MPLHLHVNKRTTSKKLIGKLQRELQARQAQYVELLEQHRQLVTQEDLLVSICKALAWARQQIAGGAEPEQQQQLLQPPPELQQALQVEQRLLQQLQALHSSSPAAAAEAAQPAPPPPPPPGVELELGGGSGQADGSSLPRSLLARVAPATLGAQPARGPVTIAPPSDPLYLFYNAVMLPLLPGSDTWQVQTHYAGIVRELALQLQLHRSGFTHAAGTPTPLTRIQQLLVLHFRILSSLVRRRRSDVNQAFVLSNMETGEVSSVADIPLYRQALQHIGLTPSQRQRVASGFAAVKPLLAAVLAEQTALQQAQAAAPSAASGTARAAASPELCASPDAAVSCSRDPLSGGEGGLSSWARDWQQQDDASARLERLMEKDMLLRTINSCIWMGALSWEQLAELMVLLSPSWPSAVVSKLLYEEEVGSGCSGS